MRLDEREAVEKPFLEQLAELGWEVVELGMGQRPEDSRRTSFKDVVMGGVLRERLKGINPWLEEDQVEEVVRGLTAGFPGSDLLKNNRHVLRLLTENTRVSENRKTGEKSPTVNIIDFAHRENNRFIAVCQLKVRIIGTERHIFPDITLFLNGLPVVVVECKSPRLREPIREAVEQLLRYSEQCGAKREGSAPLFYYNQFVVAACRQEAVFGSITTRDKRHFHRWSDPFPRTVDSLPHGASGPNDQQRLVAGMLDRDNLLDLIGAFILFSVDDKGETIKIVGRHQQFRAVKRAAARLLEGKTPRARSGVVWHTQGSGKSLTMMFMVREMYRHPLLSKWKVVFVTDRTQLEQQLSAAGRSVGFTVKTAGSIKALKALLRSDSSDLVMAMIHKFRETDLAHAFPELNPSPHILVMTDEAHRSQYALLGANLDKGIPNAARIGYTGTPIDKTERVFGDYLDKYTMRQSISDGVTLEIVYEGRTHNAEVLDKKKMDSRFEDVFSDYNIRERLEILGFGSRLAYLESEPVIEAKARDMVKHYLDHVFPNGYKAQVAAASREAAVRYKKHLDAALADAAAELETHNPLHLDPALVKKLETDVVISGGLNDKPHLRPYTNPSRNKESIKRFKLPFHGEDDGLKGNMAILIVNNMLLTGFDAPLEQVLYLDKVIRGHNLLQAIARVNRVSDHAKEKGFVVDYVGVGHHLKKAIDAYDERERKEVIDAIGFPEDELSDLRAAHAAIMDLFKKFGVNDLTDLDACYDLFSDEEARFEFRIAFKRFTRCLNLVFPAREALEFLPDYQVLNEINVMAGRHFRDGRMSMKGVPPKLRALADAHLASRGVDRKVPPISILDRDFTSEVKKRKRKRTRAAAVEHAIRHHIEVNLDDDPELQASFAEALARILEDFKDNWKRIYKELEKLRRRIMDASKEPTYGLHREKQMPLFRVFRREIFGASSPGASTSPTEQEEGASLYKTHVEPDMEARFNSSSYRGSPDDPEEAPASSETDGMSEEDRIGRLVDLTQRTHPFQGITFFYSQAI